MDTVTLTIDGREVLAPKGTTILEAASLNGIKIPTLCFLKDVKKIACCRICLCEVTGARTLLPACTTPAEQGQEVFTKSPRVLESRRKTLELLMADHRYDCTDCERGGDCELQELCQEYGADTQYYGVCERKKEEDRSDQYIVRDNSRCIQCRRCVSICNSLQLVGAINVNGVAGHTRIGMEPPLADTDCIHCGMCVAYCPVGALTERNDMDDVWRAITRKKHVVAIVSPIAAAQIGEYFGERIGTDCSGRMTAILRRLGFRRIFNVGKNTGTTVDLARRELQSRIAEGKLPVISNVCPSFKEYCQKRHPSLLNKWSVVDNPHATLAKLCKCVYAAEAGVESENIYVVSVESCLAEKGVCKKESGIDTVLTVREVVDMFKRGCVSSFTAGQVWNQLPDEPYDAFPGEDTGSQLNDDGGISQAVCEAADIKAIRISSIVEAEPLLQEVENGTCNYDYIEILACPGGCMNGGGQIHQSGNVHNFANLIQERTAALQSMK